MGILGKKNESSSLGVEETRACLHLDCGCFYLQNHTHLCSQLGTLTEKLYLSLPPASSSNSNPQVCSLTLYVWHLLFLLLCPKYPKKARGGGRKGGRLGREGGGEREGKEGGKGKREGKEKGEVGREGAWERRKREREGKRERRGGGGRKGRERKEEKQGEREEGRVKEEEAVILAQIRGYNAS